MEFREKQFDGKYEVSEVQINNKDEIFKGILYFPPEPFQKPYPLIIYFHGFPQLFPLQEIVKNYQMLLDLGYAFLVFNFRGYRYSDGHISITNQVSDAFKVFEFSTLMSRKGIFSMNHMNIVAHNFGAYISLIFCSQNKKINRLLLITPILDLRRHIYSDSFKSNLNYINKFLPGNIKGIGNVEDFITMTKNELVRKKYQIEYIINHLQNKKLKIIIGERDQITPVSEVHHILKNCNLIPEITIINGMDHEWIVDEGNDIINYEIQTYFKEES